MAERPRRALRHVTVRTLDGYKVFEANDPGAIDAAVTSLERAAKQLKNVSDARREAEPWEHLARTLKGRVQRQRSELARLHLKVRELRADVHERDERLAAMEGH